MTKFKKHNIYESGVNFVCTEKMIVLFIVNKILIHNIILNQIFYSTYLNESL